MIPTMRPASGSIRRLLVPVAAALMVLGVAAAPAAAKSERVASYPLDQTWPTAVRFLRVDEGLEIVDKDADAGYVIFAMKDGERTFKGALELIKVRDAVGRNAVRMVITIDGRPAYTEAGLLDRLLQKLKDDYGPPVEPPADKVEPPADKGKGKDGDAPADRPKARPRT
jgi:hypothetical protein